MLLIALYFIFLIAEIRRRKVSSSDLMRVFNIIEKCFFLVYLLFMLGIAAIETKSYESFELQLKVSYLLILTIFLSVTISVGFVFLNMIYDCRKKNHRRIQFI